MPIIKGMKAKSLSVKKQSPGIPMMNFGALTKFCRMKTNSFSQFAKRVETPQGPYFYQDNGSDILAIAHIDTMKPALHTTTSKLYHDTLFFCPALDDRAGVYAILDYLPNHGLKYDILLTTGEEKGESTAVFFKPPLGRKYKWIFSFDRRGTDVVMYDYWNIESQKILEFSGWKVANGTYSDIKDLEHLSCKGYNFGVGYHNEHTDLCYLSRMEFLENMRKFIRFYDNNKSIYHPHVPMYNVYDTEDGFGYLYQPRSSVYQDAFTDQDIEILEILEKEGYKFESRVNPKTIKDIIDDFQAGLLEKPETNPNQLSIPFVKEKVEEVAKPKAKAVIPAKKIILLPLVTAKLSEAKGSEDNPIYRQPRKAEIVHAPVDLTTIIHHGDKPSLYEMRRAAEADGQSTTMLDACTSCHNVYDHNIESNSTLCDDCKDLNIREEGIKKSKDILSKVPEAKTLNKVKGNIVSIIALTKRKESDEKFTYTRLNDGRGYEWQYSYPERQTTEKVAA